MNDQFEGTPYRPLEQLGAGGMGEVWLVEHRQTGRKLVAKLLHERFLRDERLLQRTRIEAQSLGRLNHAHIVSVVGFDTTGSGRPFIVMEHLDGRSLGQELAARGRLSLFEAVTYGSQILAALGAAHELGIVHRDIKPDNLFICRRGDGPYIKVLDFGVARILPGAGSVAPLPQALRTETGTIVGTPRYVSPEGAVGQHVDERADLYCVGLVLYVMLTGHGPFDHREGASNLLAAHAAELPKPPSSVSPERIPPELDAAVMKVLSKDPAARFQTANEFRLVLERVAATLVRPPEWTHTAPAPIQEWRDGESGERPLSSVPPPNSAARGSGIPPRTASITERINARVSTLTAGSAALVFAVVVLLTVGALVGAVTLVHFLRGSP